MEEGTGIVSGLQKLAITADTKPQRKTHPDRSEGVQRRENESLEEVGTRMGSSRLRVGKVSGSTTSPKTQIVPFFLSRSLWPLGVAPFIVPKWLLHLQPSPLHTCKTQKVSPGGICFYKAKKKFLEALGQLSLCISLARIVSHDNF